MSGASNIGILAIEVYIPSQAVSQAELEVADGCPGKYTKGLGQVKMAFCSDREDTVSLALSATHALLEKWELEPRQIGRVEVGSESNVDRCKSIKSHLMMLFQTHGCTDIEGSDCVHACYGGTAALLNAVSWIESSRWDGRLALVVAADVAVYAPNTPARATGGCGAVALLVGPDAPLVLESRSMASYSRHAWDFWKPVGPEPYPCMSGHSSVDMYLEALEGCSQTLQRKWNIVESKSKAENADPAHTSPTESTPLCATSPRGSQISEQCTTCENGFPVGLADFATVSGRDDGSTCGSPLLEAFDFLVFHSPFNKLVRRAVGRLALGDALRFPGRPSSVALFEHLPPDFLESVTAPSGCHGLETPETPTTAGPELDRLLVTATADIYERKVAPGTVLQRQIGNSYCASVYMGLAALVGGLSCRGGRDLAGSRIAIFSFGSGVMSSLYSLQARHTAPGARYSLEEMAQKLDLHAKLSSVSEEAPEVFNAASESLRRAHGAVPYTPEGSVEHVAPGAYYLMHVDSDGARHYARKG